MNPLRRLRPLFAILAIALVAAACGSDSDTASDNTVVASLADREFTRSQLDDLLPDGDNTVASRIASVVEAWLLAQAVELELGDRGFPITDEDRELAEEIAGDSGDRNDTEQKQLLDALSVSYAAGRFSEDASANLEDPELPGYLCSNHLLVRDRGRGRRRPAALHRR